MIDVTATLAVASAVGASASAKGCACATTESATSVLAATAGISVARADSEFCCEISAAVEFSASACIGAASTGVDSTTAAGSLNVLAASGRETDAVSARDGARDE